nr:immunoglobulin light chain junction region [Macaca mulatta]MOV74318.1 immunoglobulin light chain junction region [Macaca mulatta]MOV74657.1 immunoglobulin light chain junction region [Macaca mulatta]MOV75141.1 immunoglobulin light chain junction region [Macaca mulatta]MOV75541.1 immunoglobulin light chain junction region [Macaca mulatta]
CLHYNSDPYSF